MSGNWIRLSRSYLSNEVRKLGPEVSDTWIAVLLAVNWKPGRFKSLVVQPGQMVFSWKNLGERLYPEFENPPAINTLRTRLKQLEEVKAIRLDPTNKYTVLTVLDTSSVSGGVSKFDTPLDTQLDTQLDTDRRRVKKDKESVDLEVPESLNTVDFKSAWKQWRQHLKEKKTKTTPSAIRKQLAKCNDIGPQRAIAAIEHSIAGSYQGIFEPRTSSNGSTNGNGKADPSHKPFPARSRA